MSRYYFSHHEDDNIKELCDEMLAYCPDYFVEKWELDTRTVAVTEAKLGDPVELDLPRRWCKTHRMPLWVNDHHHGIQNIKDGKCESMLLIYVEADDD